MMRKKIFLLGSIIMSASLMIGCQKNNNVVHETDMEKSTEAETVIEEVEGLTKLIWVSEEDFDSHERYFNQVLREKNLPYEVDFI